MSFETEGRFFALLGVFLELLLGHAGSYYYKCAIPDYTITAALRSMLPLPTALPAFTQICSRESKIEGIAIALYPRVRSK